MTRTPNPRLRRKRAVASMSVVALAVAAGACGGDGGNSSAEEPESSDNGTTVVMKLIAFKPETIVVKAGGTVTWRQTDPGVHTVTSGIVEQESGGVKEAPDGLFDSGQIATGKTFDFTFEDPGTFAYFCAVHPATMRGEVTVT